MWIPIIVSILIAYLLGSIPVAHLVIRWRAGLDIRQVGDGNAGARNVWYVVGPRWGALVAALDAAKGLAAVPLADPLGAGSAGAFLAGPAAILGHAYPLLAHFNGGKGLATTFGILLAGMPLSTLAGAAVLMAAQLVLRNFDRVVPFGAAVIFLPRLFGYPWSMTWYALALFVVLWMRKLHDLPHERRVWAASGWKGVDHSDRYADSPANQETPPAPQANNESQS